MDFCALTGAGDAYYQSHFGSNGVDYTVVANPL